MNPYPPDFKLGYRPSLDGFRGVAVLLVLIAHGHLGRLPMAGGVGVTMFFVLSGFLITALLLEERRREGDVDFKGFYIRRGLRLLPPLVALLVLAAGYNLAVGRSLAPVAFAAFYAANFAEVLGHPMGYLAHMWSLSMEEQFYLFWPAALTALLAVRRQWVLVGALVAGITVSTVTRALIALPDRITADLDLPVAVRLWNGLVHRVDALLLGCLIAVLLGVVLKLGVRAATIVGVAGWAAIALVCLPPPGDMYMDVWFSVAAVAAAAALVHLVVVPDSPIARVLTLRPLKYTGRISYGLYLWHYPIFQLLRGPARRLPDGLDFLFLATVAFAVASVSFYVLEQPALRMKARFARGQERRVATAPAAP